MKAVTIKEMQGMDASAIYDYGIPSIVLMEHAAMALCDYFLKNIKKEKHILILCGPGNNGGDGFALARLLVQAGFSYVKIYCNVEYKDMSNDEYTNARIAENYHIPRIITADLKEIKHMLESADIVVDALFGTGLTRNITGFYDQLILQLNVLEKYVISIDMPSGIHGDTAQIMGVAVQASKTLTFESYKIGQIIYPGSAYCGEVIPLSIQMPKEIVEQVKGITILDDKIAKEMLPKRRSHSNKGSYGKALLIGGSKQMHGAITMCAKAALQSGIGTLTLFVPDCISFLLSLKLEESMIIEASSENGFFSMNAVDELKRILPQFDLIIIGNGMGRNDVSRALVKTVLESDCACIVDGDALYEIGKMPNMLQRTSPTILTPHIKEMSYLTGRTVNDIIKKPFETIEAFLQTYPSLTLVLKDEHTMIVNKDVGYVNLSGNNALAKGGSGDVLCGIIAGLYGQSKCAISSACCGVYIHAISADFLLHREDANSILPNDLILQLSKTFKKIRQKAV